MATIKKKYRDNPDRLESDLEEIMAHYGSKALHTKYSGYFDGVADGMNKAYKLLFDSEANVKDLKS